MKSLLSTIMRRTTCFKIALLITVLSCGWLGFAGDTNTASRASVGFLFSQNPTDLEIFNARISDEPLVPLAGEPTREENKALADALVSFENRVSPDDFSSLTNFLASNLQSSWSGSLLLSLGIDYYNLGYYSKALDAWEQAWEQCKDINNLKGKPQADRALGELARMYSKLGRMSELSDLLQSTANRNLTGPGTTLIHHAQQALWMMQNRPEVSFRCGPLALESILSYNNSATTVNPLVFYSKSTTNGFSLSEVNEFSRELGLNYQMAFRSPGAAFILPAVVHWKVGHYAAILKRVGDRFLVEDHTFHSSLLMSSAALETESSGNFLVPGGKLPAGWRSISDQEAQMVFGKGTVGNKQPAATSPFDKKSGGNITCEPMTGYTMDTLLVSLNLQDTPLKYTPPVGPAFNFTVTYNHLEANQPAVFGFSNFGAKWSCNWVSYITAFEPGTGYNIGNTASLYLPGGGSITFSGFIGNGTGSYAVDPLTQTRLVITSPLEYANPSPYSPATFELQFPDGSKYEYTQSLSVLGNNVFEQAFLTQIIDPAGNLITLNYGITTNLDFKINNIVDAIGQTNIFLYTNATSQLLITGIVDPFGRAVNFDYNTNGQLAQITDVLGIASQFFYSSNDFVSTLVTPYGTTTFSNSNANGITTLKATDPLGESEFLEFSQSSGVPNSDPSDVVPRGMGTFNTYLYGRDSFFWGKKAYAEGAGDVTKAKIYHWLHEADLSTASRITESIKEPLENRVWNNYPGQPTNSTLYGGSNFLGSAVIGTSSKPSATGHVLDDGTTQISYYQYNAIGNMTNSIDPVGRNFTYIYDTNDVDLLEAHMTRNGKNELLSSATYNSQHRPVTVTDAAGQTTTNTYNPQGQILKTLDPKGEVTSFSYDTNGYLLAITGPLQNPNDVTSFTYDGFSRVRTVADTEGYTITFDYDAANRNTQVTYPDGTYEQFVYNLLDLAASRDRLGRWTTNTYNADRQLMQTTDPLGRTTTYDWCNCGALTGLTDPMGRTTTWRYDVQSRPIAKTYPDGSTITYQYENSTSRLKSRWDEKGQQTVYSYYSDNNLKSVSYLNAIVTTPTVNYTYDPDYNRIVTMQDGIGITVYYYNPITPIPALGVGQLASVSGPLPNSTVSYQYDQLNRVINRSINGVAQAATYDVVGRPITVTNALGSFQYSYVDATARLASEAYPNGQTNLNSYFNNFGDERLKQIQHLYPNGSLLSGFGYAYNSVGQIIAWTNEWDSLPTRVWNPSYDAADQLTNVASAGGSSPATNYAYAYDPAGNRLLEQINKVTNNYFYNALNQLNSASPGPTNAATYEWDAENRLTAINQGTNSSEFSYDGLGRRVQIRELVNGVVMTNNYFLWCGADICEERDTTGATPVKRYFDDGVQVVSGVGAGNYFYTKDHLGSIRELVDTTGTLRARYDYDPFGSPSKLPGDFYSDFGFTGFYYHSPSELQLAQYRAYNSELGRWLNRDPIGERGGVNLYEYVASNPLNTFDLEGLAGVGFLPIIPGGSGLGALGPGSTFNGGKNPPPIGGGGPPYPPPLDPCGPNGCPQPIPTLSWRPPPPDPFDPILDVLFDPNSPGPFVLYPLSPRGPFVLLPPSPILGSCSQ